LHQCIAVGSHGDDEELTTAAKGWVAMTAEGVPNQQACCCVKVK
jgi:hypothetical protein